MNRIVSFFKRKFSESSFANERLEIFYETQWKPILGAFLLSTVFCIWSFFKTEDSFYLIFWVAYNFVSLIRLSCSKLFFTQRSQLSMIRWNWVFNIGMFAHGVLWSFIGFYTSYSTHDDLLNLTIALLLAVSASNIIAYPSNRLSHYVYVPMVLLPYCFGIIANKQTDHEIVAILVASLFVPISILASLNNFRMVIRLLKESAMKGRMEIELQMAKQIQNISLPPHSKKLQGVEIAGHYESATECGGDWWHYYSASDEKLYIWIGDVTGHGVGSALLATSARAAATIIEQQNLTPAAALTVLNRCLYDLSRGELMMTCFVACIDHRNQKITYSNASHHIPMLLQAGEQNLDRNDITFLDEARNPMLALHEEVEFVDVTVNFKTGDRLVLFTDGLIEATNRKLTQWGERSFLKYLLELNADRSSDPNLIVEKILAELNRFRGSEPLKDDITLVVCEAS